VGGEGVDMEKGSFGCGSANGLKEIKMSEITSLLVPNELSRFMKPIGDCNAGRETTFGNEGNIIVACEKKSCNNGTMLRNFVCNCCSVPGFC